MTKAEQNFLETVANRCSVGRISISKEDEKCFECKAIKAACEYTDELEAENAELKERIKFALDYLPETPHKAMDYLEPVKKGTAKWI